MQKYNLKKKRISSFSCSFSSGNGLAVILY